MGSTFVDMAMSLDGFIAGPNGRPGNPLGDGGTPPPFRAPVFVLTHHPRELWVRQGGTTFHFVTDGIERAI